MEMKSNLTFIMMFCFLVDNDLEKKLISGKILGRIQLSMRCHVIRNINYHYVAMKTLEW